MIVKRNKMKHSIFFTALSVIALWACSPSGADVKPQEPVLPQITVSELKTENGKTYVEVDGTPFPFMGAQIRLDALINSENKPVSAIEPYFQKAVELGVNCVQVPVCWRWIEPSEGNYDWSVVDALLGYCLEYDLKMELLWFSTNMIGDSFTYFLPRYVISEPSIRLWRSNEGFFRSDYGYTYALILDADWLLQRETAAVTALFNHIRYWDSKHGDTHPVITCQIHNEPDGFVRWRYGGDGFTWRDGSELSRERAWEMVLNSLNAVGKAVQNSSYKVLTRTNHIKADNVNTPLDWGETVSPQNIFDLEGIDFVSIDAYRQTVSDINKEVSAYASISGNYALVGENKGNYEHAPSLILAAFAAGGGYDIYDLATSSVFITNAGGTDDPDHGVYTSDLQERPGFTEKVRKIVKGLSAAGADLAVTPPSSFAAFNISADEPQTSFSGEFTSASTSTKIGFSTTEGAIGFALDMGTYIVAYSTESATFVITASGSAAVTVNAEGGKLYRQEL